MKVTVISIAVGVLVIFPRCLEKRQRELEIRGRIKTIKAAKLIKSARILRRVLQTCCPLKFSEKPPVKTGVKNLPTLN